MCTYIHSNYCSVYCINAISTATAQGPRPHAHWSGVDCTLTAHLASAESLLTGVGGATLPSGTHPLVVRLSAPESHESQRLLTPKDGTDSHQPHCHRQQCPAVTGAGLGEEGGGGGGGQERRMQGTQRGSVELQHSLADTSAPNETTLHTFVSPCGVPCINIQTSRLDLVLERYAQRSQLLNNMQLQLSQGQLQHTILHTVPSHADCETLRGGGTQT